MAESTSDSPETPPESIWSGTLGTTLMLVAVGSAVVGFVVLFSIWWSSEVTDKYRILRVAAQEYVAGRPIVAGELAETAAFDSDVDRETMTSADALDDNDQTTATSSADGVTDNDSEEDSDAQWIRLRNFLVGAGKVARAQNEDDIRQRRRLLEEAIPVLEASAEAGFPAGRHAVGNRLLGQALFDVNRFAEAVKGFQAAIERDPTLRRELMPTLARAQLQSSENMVEDALATIDDYLQDSSQKPAQRREAQQTRIEALIKLRRWQEAESAVAEALKENEAESLGLTSEDVDFRDQIRLMRAIIEVTRARERYGPRPSPSFPDRRVVIAELAPTMRLLIDLQREAAPKVAAKARLWSARASLCQGSIDNALIQLTAVRQQRPFGAEGIVGGIEEFELLAEQGRGIEALQTTRYVVRELGDRSGFDASLITFDEFRRRMSAAIAELRNHGKFKDSIDIARSLSPVFERSEALMQEGLGFREWAAMTLQEGTDINGDVARSASMLSRKRFRAAGDAFAEAAQNDFNTERFLPTQWSAIDAYQKGRHFRRSIQLLKPYLRYERRRRQPRGLVAYGRALLAEGDPAEAIKSLTEAIVEFPRDPLRYDARLMAALAYADQGDVAEARRLLTENLRDGELTPQSPAWRDSLFTLGELLYRQSYANHLAATQSKPDQRLAMLRENQPNLDETIRYLDEAVERYWPLSRAEGAAYLAARTHAMSAQWPRAEATSSEILDAARRSLRARADSALQTALQGFQSLTDHLVTIEEDHRLSQRNQSMLRNCLMGQADTLRGMAQLDAAADAYRTVAMRYMNEPPALEAILAQSRCLKEMGRDGEAEALIHQAAVILQRIPSEWDDRFQQITRYDRAGWEKLLTWMSGRIETAKRPTTETTNR